MGGLGHDFKVGVNFINEPRLFITFNTGKGAIFNTHLTNDLNGPISTVTVSDGDASANIPTKQFATYFQDDWRVSDRLTVNCGVRYDLMTGVPVRPVEEPELRRRCRRRGAAGQLNGHRRPRELRPGAAGRQEQHPAAHRRACSTSRGDGKDIVRGGWGIYTDFGYTNSNVLFAAADATGNGFGHVFNVNNQAGIRNPDGSFYRAGQPLTNIPSQNQVARRRVRRCSASGSIRASRQPYQMQTNVGWSHELTADTVLSVDYVNSLGRDLNFRPRVNQRIPGNVDPPRLGAAADAAQPEHQRQPSGAQPRQSEYNAPDPQRAPAPVEGRRLHRVVHAAEGREHDRQRVRRAEHREHPGPEQSVRRAACSSGRTARPTPATSINLSAVVPAAGRLRRRADLSSTARRCRSTSIDGRDLNLDGDATDIPAQRVRGRPRSIRRHRQSSTVKEIGTCETVNCGRGWSQTQMNIRLSKVFRLGGRARIEAIGEVFNLFNAINPSGFRARVDPSPAHRPASRIRRCCSRPRSRATSVVPNSASASSGSGSCSNAEGATLRVASGR